MTKTKDEIWNEFIAGGRNELIKAFGVTASEIGVTSDLPANRTLLAFEWFYETTPQTQEDSKKDFNENKGN